MPLPNIAYWDSVNGADACWASMPEHDVEGYGSIGGSQGRYCRYRGDYRIGLCRKHYIEIVGPADREEDDGEIQRRLAASVDNCDWSAVARGG